MDAILDDIIAQAEAMLERRAAGLAICQPKALAQQNITPEVDLPAISFFRKFNQRRKEILESDELMAIKIAISCSGDDFWNLYRTTNDPRQEFIAFQEAKKISKELAAVRTSRKAIQWVESSGILQEVTYGG